MKDQIATKEIVDSWKNRHGFVLQLIPGTPVSAEEVKKVSDEIKRLGYTTDDIEYFSFVNDVLVLVYGEDAAVSTGYFYQDMIQIPFKGQTFDILSHFATMLANEL